jgi:hypothetical protein
LQYRKLALPLEFPFESVQDVYWSSTSSLFEPDWAWALYLNNGAIGFRAESAGEILRLGSAKLI